MHNGHNRPSYRISLDRLFFECEQKRIELASSHEPPRCYQLTHTLQKHRHPPHLNYPELKFSFYYTISTGIWSVSLRRSISLKQKKNYAKNYQPPSNHLKLLVTIAMRPIHLYLMTFAAHRHTATTYHFFSYISAHTFNGHY